MLPAERVDPLVLLDARAGMLPSDRVVV